ncbi:hypothetical protein IE53DRAFT_389883, partial [Violaceomyces palustris]
MSYSAGAPTIDETSPLLDPTTGSHSRNSRDKGKQRSRSSSPCPLSLPPPETDRIGRRYSRQSSHLDVEVQDTHDPRGSTSNLIPFPSQADPSKPLRPPNYSSRTSLVGIKGFVARNQGVLLIALSQVFYSTMNLFFKLLNSVDPHGPKRTDGSEDDAREPISALEVIFIRMSITWLGCVGWMLLTRTPHPVLGPPGIRHLLALRGFVGFFGLFGLYYSLQFLSLADATVITFLGPLGTGLLGYLILGEKFTVREAVGGITSLFGVVLIARPTFLFGRIEDGSDLDVPVGEESLNFSGFFTNTSTGLGSYSSISMSDPLSGIDFRPSSTEMIKATLETTVANLTRLAATSYASIADPTLTARNFTVPEPHDGPVEPEGVTEAQRLLAVGLALLGVCGGSAAYTTIRAIGKRATPTHSVAYFSLYSSIVSLTLMKLTGTSFVLPANAKWFALLCCIGFFGLVAQ